MPDPQKLEEGPKESGCGCLSLFLPILPHLKLSELPLSVNRAREGWDIHHLYRRVGDHGSHDSVVLSQPGLDTSSPCEGMHQLANLPDGDVR